MLEDYRLFVAQNLAGITPETQVDIRLITGDASFRKYYRVSTETHHYILMVSPPDLVDNHPFIKLNHSFRDAGIKVPSILAVNQEQGLLLLEDLGETHFADCLGTAKDIEYYQNAIDLLPKIAEIPASDAMKPYDAAFIDLELEIFKTWLVEAFCNLTFDIGAEKTWLQVKGQLINALEMQPKVTMHRDYHSRNLMLWQNQLAVIDYQDAVTGPVSYDLVSLIKDCYVVLPAEQRSTLLKYGYEKYKESGLSGHLSFDDFSLLLTLTGIQRHLKAAGIFCRLSLRDGKDGYLPNVLTTLDYVVEACEEVRDTFPAFHYFSQWLTSSILPVLKEKL